MTVPTMVRLPFIWRLPHFSDFLSDLEIYVDNLASAQIRNMNKYIEHNRAMIKNKYSLSDSDHYMRSLKAALIDEDNYFDNLLGNDISAIAKNLRELHKKDSNTGSNDTVFDEFMDTCEEVQKADSITQKQMLTYSKLFQMNFTKMDPYEFKTFMDIVERYSTAFKSAKGNGREYYGAAEPPVRCGESHLSGLTEPPQFVY